MLVYEFSEALLIFYEICVRFSTLCVILFSSYRMCESHARCVRVDRSAVAFAPSVPYPKLFVYFSVSLRCHHGWHQGENFEILSFWISGNCLSGVFLVHFLYIMSAIFFVVKLVVIVHAYIMSTIALILKGQKILLEFPI